MLIVKTPGLFVLTVIAEIVDCYLRYLTATDIVGALVAPSGMAISCGADGSPSGLSTKLAPLR